MVKDAIYVLGGLAVVVFFAVRERRSDRFRERWRPEPGAALQSA
jgi:hypothetical protein